MWHTFVIFYNLYLICFYSGKMFLLVHKFGKKTDQIWGGYCKPSFRKSEWGLWEAAKCVLTTEWYNCRDRYDHTFFLFPHVTKSRVVMALYRIRTITLTHWSGWDPRNETEITTEITAWSSSKLGHLIIIFSLERSVEPSTQVIPRSNVAHQLRTKFLVSPIQQWDLMSPLPEARDHCAAWRA